MALGIYPHSGWIDSGETPRRLIPDDGDEEQDGHDILGD